MTTKTLNKLVYKPNYNVEQKIIISNELDYRHIIYLHKPINIWIVGEK